MVKRLIVLSGPVASGKTTLCSTLVQRYGFQVLKTQQLIREQLGSALERLALQKAGEELDERTKGRWVADAVVRKTQDLPQDAVVVVDAIRIEKQVEAIREAFGPRVVHVHLTAPQEVLSQRYAGRSGVMKELSSYEAVRSNPTEAHVERLAAVADILIDTQRATKADVVVRVAGHLGLYGRGLERLVDVLVGGQYGSEGKGQVAAYLAREYDVLVRVGGPNAGHKVYAEPEPITFHQLPSGTRHSEASILLGPGAVISLPTLQQEIAAHDISPERLAIDPQAMIIAEQDIESEVGTLVKSIGSTGQGVGAATARKILRSAAKPSVTLAKDVKDLRPYIRETLLELERAFSAGRRVFLEGTQGTGLSLHHGSYPYVTSRDTTVSGCLAEAGIAPSRVRKIIIVCRTYPIRVQDPKGATSGPMSQELSLATIADRSGVPIDDLKKTERTSTTNRKRRIAEFDWALLRRATSLNGPTDVALTFADYLAVSNRSARRFEQLTPDTIRFIEEVERVAGAPVSLITTRFHSRSIIDRRAW